MKTGRTTPGVVELGVKLNKTRTNTMKVEDGEIPIKRGSLQMSYQYALEGVVGYWSHQNRTSSSKSLEEGNWGWKGEKWKSFETTVLSG